jgi:hypothetical protein
MAKKRSNQLLGGVRRRVESAVTSRRRGRKKQQGVAGRAVMQLRSAVATITRRDTTVDPMPSQAAKKAARTRQRKAAKRSAAARKGARTRARAGAR